MTMRNARTTENAEKKKHQSNPINASCRRKPKCPLLATSQSSIKSQEIKSASHATTMSGNVKADGTITAAGRGRVCIPTAEKNAQFRKLKNVRDNQTCFDCPNTRPSWASVTYGTVHTLSHSHRFRMFHSFDKPIL